MPSCPLRWAWLLSTIAAALLWASFPALNLWWLTPAAVALFSVTSAVVSPKTAAWLGLWCGILFMGAHVTWVYYLGGITPWVGIIATQCGFFAVLGWATSWLYRFDWPQRWRRYAPITGTAGLWVAVEWCRSQVPFGGFSWGRLVYAQADAPVVWWARLGGTALVTWAVVAVSGLLIAAMLTAHRGYASALILGAAVLYVAPWAVNAQTVPHSGTVQVAAVQGNAPALGLGYNRPYGALTQLHLAEFGRYVDQVKAGHQAAPDLVVLPENGIDIAPLQDHKTHQQITDLVTQVGADTLVGAVTYNESDQPRNTVLQWRPGLGVVGQYHKQTLVPFGEYIPLRSFFEKISSLVRQVTTNFVPGTEPGLLTVKTADQEVIVGVATCVEVSKDWVLGELISGGAQLLVVPSNTAQFGRTAESAQQLAMARVRAIEYGRSVVQVTTVGVSGLITPDGHVVTHSSISEAKTLTAELPIVRSITMSNSLRVSLEFTLAIMGLFLVVYVRLTQFRRQRLRRLAA